MAQKMLYFDRLSIYLGICPLMTLQVICEGVEHCVKIAETAPLNLSAYNLLLLIIRFFKIYIARNRRK